MKSGKVGAFPSNFTKEIFVSPKGGIFKWPFFLHCGVTVRVLRVDLNQYILIELPSQSFSDVKHNESKTRPKLSDTMFSKEVWNAR